MFHPLHPGHTLELTDASDVYSHYAGRWKCDNCNQEITRGQPYHCNQCQFDLCQRCYIGNNHTSHPHPLFYINTEQQCYPQFNGLWQCDVCMRSCQTLNQSHSYHCNQCTFDLCTDCFRNISHPMHEHELCVIDTAVIYHESGGQWKCDCCTKIFRPTHNNKRYTVLTAK